MQEVGEEHLVSVVIPTYNRGAVITRTLESLGAVTYSPLEVVVADDGSTDNTCDAVQSAARKMPGIRWRFLRQPNLGACAARNLGLLHSRGEFIQFLDSDDGVMPSKLSSQVQLFRRRPALDLVYCLTEYRHIHNEQRPGPTQIFGESPKDLLAAFVRHCQFSVNAPLWRRPVCVQAGPWSTELPSSQDWE
jgi:glycosyltransferase involved in cell wall biosynthesis